jgi:hypothetical protein
MPALTVFGELFFGGVALIVAGFVALFVVCVIGGAAVDVFRSAKRRVDARIHER